MARQNLTDSQRSGAGPGRARSESDPHGGWPAPDRVGLTFSDPDDENGAYAEYVRADLHEGAVSALHEAIELLDNARPDFGDQLLKRRWAARRKALRAKWWQ